MRFHHRDRSIHIYVYIKISMGFILLLGISTTYEPGRATLPMETKATCSTLQRDYMVLQKLIEIKNFLISL